MRPIFRRSAFFVAWLLAALAPADANARAVNFITNTSIPVDAVIEEPCGTGDLVQFSGELHFLSHVTIDDRTGLHAVIEMNLHDVTGESLLTGNTYRAVGAFHDMVEDNGSTSQVVTSTIALERHIAEGPASDFTLFLQFHVTVNSNGEVTASFLNQRAECSP